jgi:hypothetical protein
MRTPATQQALVPAATGFDIGNANEWLWTHASKLSKKLYSGNPIFF